MIRCGLDLSGLALALVTCIFFSVVNMGFLNIRASARFPSGTLLYGFSLL